MKRRITSILLVMCIALSFMMPTSAIAEETPVCNCEATCTAENMNADCPVCGADGALPENCGRYATAVVQKKNEPEEVVENNIIAKDETAGKLQTTEGSKNTEVSQSTDAVQTTEAPPNTTSNGKIEEPGTSVQSGKVLSKVPSTVARASANSTVYTLHYDANGGSGVPADQNGSRDARGLVMFTLSNTVPIREGYVFKGWTKEKNVDWGKYPPGSTAAFSTQDIQWEVSVFYHLAM